MLKLSVPTVSKDKMYHKVSDLCKTSDKLYSYILYALGMAFIIVKLCKYRVIMNMFAGYLDA